MSLAVGLNGAGRIGRVLLRLLRDDPQVRIVAVNDVADPDLLVHLLRHDSIHGPFPGRVERPDEGILAIDGRPVRLTARNRPERIPWEAAGAEVVVDATGAFTGRGAARGHLERPGVRRVIVSAVSDEPDAVVVLGVHDGTVPDAARVVSTGSCTTHAAALPLLLLDRAFGIVAAEVGTVHCTTGSQPAIDLPHRDRRRARSALLSMIPTTTSASRGLAAALPRLAGRLTCHAIRVPVATVSLVDIVAQTERPLPDLDGLRRLFVDAAAGPLRGLLGTSEDELVSIDFRGDPRSAIVDLPLIARPGDHLVRVIAWYDNEWGYANRLADLLRIWSRDARPGESSR
ncbi:MAG: hypothetical protein D6738_01250 [Acidobacteria bacterium]|nr:MAG: hypothetical protein D6738_01250 [Acidobacteriota bacterium]